MQNTGTDNVWLQLAAPIVTLSTALLTLGVNTFRDFSSISRRTRVFELEKKRLEYWKLHGELTAGSPAGEMQEDLTLSAARVGRLADEDRHRTRRVLGEAVVVFGFIGSLTAFVQNARILWPGMPAQWRTGLTVLGTSFAFLLVSYAVDFARELIEIAKTKKPPPEPPKS